MLPISEPAV
ncbi:hypothetical protein D031_3012A, partial [Vibrio parahaemolyticus VP-48]